MLAGECVCALAAARLDPRLGTLHQPRAGRAALALDLMEPFRPLIADQAVLGGLNLGQLKPADAEDQGRGWQLTDAGRRCVLDLLEKRLTTAITIAGSDAPVSYREAIGKQAQAIARTLKSGEAFTALERA